MAPNRVQGLMMPNLVRRILDRPGSRQFLAGLTHSGPSYQPTPLPRRGDHVEAWLKQQRDRHRQQTDDWFHIDELLDDYRLHADTGTPLHEHACEGSFCEHDDEEPPVPPRRGIAGAYDAIAQARGDAEPPPSHYGYA